MPRKVSTFSLHDALPISNRLDCSSTRTVRHACRSNTITRTTITTVMASSIPPTARSDTRSDYRSEEHTSELQSHVNIVCRLLLEKKKTMAELAIAMIVAS